MNTTRDAFNTFHAKILPTSSQTESMAKKLDATRNYLLQGFGNDSNMPLLSASLIGSTHRNTVIRPLDDIDVMAVFSDAQDVYEDTYQYDSQKFITRIRNVLDQDCTTVIGTRGQAVRLFYKSGAHVDIAPVFKASEGHFLLPKGDGTWISTNPNQHAMWLDSQEQRLSTHIRPVIRLLKRWNNEHSKYFKSYHLEVVAANSFSSLGANWREALAIFFKWAPLHIDSHDPAGHSGNLAAYLNPLSRAALLSRLQNAAERAELALQAEANGNHEEAMRLWKIELGSEFPTYA